MRSGLRSDCPHNFDSAVTQLEVTVFQYIALSKLHRNDKKKKKNYYGTFCDISFCPLSDNLFKFLWKWWHKLYDYMQNSYFPDPFCPFQVKNIFVSAEKQNIYMLFKYLQLFLKQVNEIWGWGPCHFFELLIIKQIMG